MNFSKSFTYMFDDPNWASKYLIGILISLAPILNLAWFGYGIGIMRNIARGEERPLPSWDSIGEKFKDGLLVGIAIFIYLLPVWIILTVVSIVAVIPAALASGTDAEQILNSLGSGVAFLMSCCILLFALLFSFLLPAMMIHYARQDTFASLFQVRDIIGLATKNIGEYLLAWLAGFLAALVLGFVASVPCIGWVVAAFFGAAWMTSVSFYAYGQVGLSLTEPANPALVS
jgi:hypothetical protein